MPQNPNHIQESFTVEFPIVSLWRSVVLPRDSILCAARAQFGTGDFIFFVRGYYVAGPTRSAIHAFAYYQMNSTTLASTRFTQLDLEYVFVSR